jgi:hypothetical protein
VSTPKKETVRIELPPLRSSWWHKGGKTATRPTPAAVSVGLKKATVRISLPPGRGQGTGSRYAVPGMIISHGRAKPTSADTLMRHKGIFAYARWYLGKFFRLSRYPRRYS